MDSGKMHGGRPFSFRSSSKSYDAPPDSTSPERNCRSENKAPVVLQVLPESKLDQNCTTVWESERNHILSYIQIAMLVY